MAARVAIAHVVHWNKTWMWVRCLFCGCIELHSFNGDYSTVNIRKSLCVTFEEGRPITRTYQCLFPFDTASHEAAHEIDKLNGMFIAAGIDLPTYLSKQDQDQHLSLRRDAESRPRWSQLTEMVTDASSPTPQLLYCSVLNSLEKGDVATIKEYLDRSAEADIFLHGVEVFTSGDNKVANINRNQGEKEFISGKTVLHVAAGEASAEIVALLLKRGVNPNAADHNGRTSLMEAAIWGRTANVRLLLRNGARKDLNWFCGGRKYQAMDTGSSSSLPDR